ncbi:hypothetical protein [Micromonospora gifhornensis]|uniref:hypothetical protein n=1 Tax=Micromonospora gifhornensis TaxID=84594 RepID=UPI003662BBD3
MNEGSPGAPAGRTWRWWPALRLALVLLWLLAAGMTWWTAPRQQGYDQARADAAAGRITAYQWGDRWEVSTPPRWFGAPALHSSDTLGPLFAPYGLGLLYWWARERPWSASATPAAHVDRRDSGILGLGLGILASILISLVLLALHTALGDRWVPQPGT